MNKVYVMDNRGREKEATKVRYFKYNNNKYFVYTLDELDNEGYVKLYIKKIVGDEDQPISDSEWPNVKEIVQEVFREIKAGTHYSYEDLNLNNINEIMDSGARVFKLKKTVVDDILSKVVDEDQALENDINTKLINSLKKTDEDSKNKNPFTNDNQINGDDLNASLLNLLKRVEKVSEEENLFKTPDTLVNEEPKEEIKIDDGIDSIAQTKVEDSKIDTDSSLDNKQENKKLKSLVVGSVPVAQYQEKISKLEQEIKEYKDMIFNLKKEVEQQKSINNKLNTQMENSKMIISRYEERINNLKNIVKDI